MDVRLIVDGRGSQITEVLLLRNIHFRQFIGDFFFSLCIEHLPNFYSVRPSEFFFKPNWSYREHLSLAFPTETIFHLLR